jgi:hypothetical protein
MSIVAKVWLRNVVKCGKYSLAKFANFVLRAEIATFFGPNVQNLQTLQGYIFRILEHFATKLCNFT